MWYSPASIRFSRDEIIWIIAEVLTLPAGEWPPECRETGYTGGKKGSFNAASFEKASLVRACVESRLEKTGKDGKCLIKEINEGVNDYFLLEKRESRQALDYMSGYDERKVSYKNWKEAESMPRPCEECGHNRWHTIIKGLAWKCRKCGYVRNSEAVKEKLEILSK